MYDLKYDNPSDEFWKYFAIFLTLFLIIGAFMNNIMILIVLVSMLIVILIPE